jgi:hypothetical protein
MKGGVPPTLRKERTGLCTPPGMCCLAAAKALAADLSREKSHGVFFLSLFFEPPDGVQGVVGDDDVGRRPV